MSTIHDLTSKPLSQMSTEELHEYLRRIRHARRTPKPSTTKRQQKKASQKAKEASHPDVSSLPKEMIAQLLKDLEVEE